MKDVLAQICDVSKMYEDAEGDAVFRALDSEHSNRLLRYDRIVKGLGMELTQVLRHNDQLETESIHLRHTFKKLEDSLSQLTRIRHPHAKNLVKLEDEIFELEEEVKRKKAGIEEREDLLRSGLKPSVDALFLELVRGFEVDFVDKDGIRALIKNRDRNDIINLEIDGSRNPWKISNEIWENI